MRINNQTTTIFSLITSIVISALLISCGAGGAGGGGGGGGPATDLICPAIPYENGVLQADLAPASGTNFSAALLGTFDRLDTGNIVGGMDWFSTDSEEFSSTSMGTQIISWWTQKIGKNTKLQITNHSSSQSVGYHVQIFDEDCLEIRDFCDQLTPSDTHVYDFSNLITNTGSIIASGGLAGEEGFVTITPSVSCISDLRATSFGFLSGKTKVADTARGFMYGMNAWARDADTATSCTGTVAGGFKILTGSGDCRLNPELPTEISHVFSKTSDSDASRSDVIFINISDNYSPNYLASGGSSTIIPVMFDMDEVVQSCAPRNVCYLRVGLNDAIKDSDDPLPPPASACDSSAPGAIIGTPGDDVLSGTPGNDVIIGLGGNDTITGGSGADCIDGGPGNDTINAGSGPDTVYGGKGNDSIEGRAGTDNIFGEEGDDTIEGNGGPDTLDGGPGTDDLDGGGGSDTCTNGETLTSC